MSESKFIQRIGLIGLTNIIITVMTIFLLPILTKNLSIQEYGIWVQVTITVTLIQIIATLGLNNGMIRFLASSNDKNEIKEGFYSIFIIVFVINLIAVLILFLLFHITSKILFANYIVIGLILPFLVFFYCLYKITINYFLTFNKIKKYCIFLILQNLFSLLLTSYFALFDYGIVGVVFGYLLAQVLTFSSIIVVILFELGIKIPKFKNFKKYLRFSFPTIFNDLAYWLINSSDRYVISFFLGVTYVGYYSPAYTLGTMLTILISPFTTILSPTLSNYYDNNQINKVNRTLQYSLKYFLVFSIPAVVGLSFLSFSLLNTLTTSLIAENSYFITPVIAISILVYGIYLIISQIIFLEKKMAILGYFWIFSSIVNVSLNIVFVPYLGIMGAAVVTLISYLSLLILTTYYSFRYLNFNLSLNIGYMPKIIIISILMSLIIIIFNSKDILGIVFVIFISVCFYLISIILVGVIGKKELIFVKKIIMNSLQIV